MSMMILY